MSLMNFQMTRVISSPSSSTTGPLTLILASLDICVRILHQVGSMGERLLVRPAYKEPSRASKGPQSGLLASSPCNKIVFVLVMSASAKPRLAGRQPSNRGGVPRVKTRSSSHRLRGKRGSAITDP